MSQTFPSASKGVSSFTPPLPFACSRKPDGFESVWVHLRGELDLATLPSFQQTLGEAQLSANTVSIDLEGLEFIDCTALGAIVAAERLARRKGGRLILVRGSGQVARVLALTGLLEETETVDLGLTPAPPACPPAPGREW
jgi:anti-anti-sigma factor